MTYQHPRSRRLAVVLNLKRREEKEALQRWGDIEQRLTAEKDKRTQLDTYAQEYRRQITRPADQSVAAGQIHNSLEFIGQIETALAQQDSQLKELEALSQRARDAYLEIHHKADALESMIDKLEEEHKLATSRAEQREADEWANRRR
ncbi:MAG: flagellar export protein FliJ [Oceanospirillaceae bacterium]|uniref:flagellar export protein FliJ n=1 Tax=Thalassolituus sp. TaxID=2030822 RepID=UPI000C3A03D0|nr:flagellar export protein FliJ [Thalassolituus sp.]MAE33645.1 flagellar export protein FliJ [Oceanospirillaceae bacterium]MDQ4423464.1 flagellar export protein FliJ [Thalassolituus sp.]MDQ4426209.1 flagellar export protein FliJ [Thalassolituus sp.]